MWAGVQSNSALLHFNMKPSWLTTNLPFGECIWSLTFPAAALECIISALCGYVTLIGVDAVASSSGTHPLLAKGKCRISQPYASVLALETILTCATNTQRLRD